MKKFIFSALAAIGLLLSPSCSDENEVLSGSDNEALVSFNVNLADGISTKAEDDSYIIGKGEKVNTLHVKVYESANNAADGAVAEHISDLDQTTNINVGSSTEVSFSLVKGKTYHFLFWAQYEKTGWTPPYELNDDGTVTIDYSNNGSTSPLSNDERYDAFVATETRTITTDISFNVKLTRPFAQLNFLTTAADIQKAAAGRIIPGSDFSGESLNSIVTINDVAKTLNPFTKKVSGSQSVTFKANATPFTITHTSGAYIEDNFTVAATGTNNKVSITPQGGSTAKTYYYLATNYFLVYTGENGDASADATLTSAKLEIVNSDYRALVIPNIPVKQNYRTNIYGDLLTAGGTFNVEINNEFGGPDNNKEFITEASVSSLDALKTALDDPNITTITLTADIDLTDDLTIDRDVTIMGAPTANAETKGGYGFKAPTRNGYKVTVNPNASVTFTNITFTNGGYALTAENYAKTLTIENCIFVASTQSNTGTGFDDGAIQVTTNGGTVKIDNNGFTAPDGPSQATFLDIKGANSTQDLTATLTVTNNSFADPSTLMDGSAAIVIQYLKANNITVGNNTLAGSVTKYFGSDGSLSVNNNDNQMANTATLLKDYFEGSSINLARNPGGGGEAN